MEHDDVRLPADWARREAEPARKNVRRLSAHNHERIELEADSDRPGERIPVACECGDPACFDPLPLTAAEFGRAHARPGRYVVVPSHVMPDYERVVELADSYWIVEKRSPAKGGLLGSR
jgi:hypothetical protein